MLMVLWVSRPVGPCAMVGEEMGRGGGREKGGGVIQLDKSTVITLIISLYIMTRVNNLSDCVWSRIEERQQHLLLYM